MDAGKVQRTWPQRAERSGFSLLEIVVAVTIMTILVGAAVPVTSKVVAYKARKATKQELQLLAEAVSAYTHDTLALPVVLEDLLVYSGVDGWSGPYLPGVVTDELTQLPGYLVDAWSRPYELAASGDVLTIRSRGDDGVSGTDKDIALALDVTPIRRARTLERLAVVNQAIHAYNDLYLATAPLSTSWGTAFGQLVAAGFLPNAADYQTDAWGDAFVPVPVGQSPVVAAGSIHVGS